MGSGGSSGCGHGFLESLCVRRPDGGGCCDVNDSIFGEDAFYRDAFYDCEEGNRSHDLLFASAREQARLKIRKGSMLANYASFEIKRKAKTESRAVSSALKQCIAPSAEDLDSAGMSRKGLRSPKKHQDAGGAEKGGGWLGTTIPEWTEAEFPETGDGPYWQKGEGDGFRVRCGPNYRKSGQKCDSNGSMYRALACDAIRSSTKIENVITHFNGGKLPPPPEHLCDSDRGGGGALQWTPDCPLPRVICINLMLPYTTGVIPMRPDAGCSFVGFFHITPQTIKAVQSEDPPPAVRLFRAFFEGPAGEPNGPHNKPDRSLFARVNKKVKKDQQAGLFKAIAHCINPQDVHVPEMFHTYNGKPCLITKCGYVIKDPNREWLEVGIDVRGFNILARKMLCSFRPLLPRTKIHYGFLVQGVEDEDMPEGVLCDMYVHGINMLEDPIHLDELLCGEGPRGCAKEEQRKAFR